MACRCLLLANALLFSGTAQSSQVNVTTRGGSFDIQSDGEATPLNGIVPQFPECGSPAPRMYGDGCRSAACQDREGYIACDIVQDDPKNPDWRKRGKCTKNAYVLETNFGCLQAASKSLLESFSIPSLVEALYTNSANGTCAWWDLACKSLVITVHSIGEIRPVTSANDCYAMGYHSTVCNGALNHWGDCDGGSPFYSSGLDVFCKTWGHGICGKSRALHTYTAGQFGCKSGPLPPSPAAFFA